MKRTLLFLLLISLMCEGVLCAVDYCNEDYHWYRQNPDGTWSHKPGKSEVTNLDASGELIFDPEICDRNYETSSGINYNEFIGYFAVTPLEE